MVEFSEGKFFLCRELFLTKSSVNRTECSVPFCDRGVFRMFISNPASCTYKKVYYLMKSKEKRKFFKRRKTDIWVRSSDIWESTRARSRS